MPRNAVKSRALIERLLNHIASGTSLTRASQIENVSSPGTALGWLLRPEWREEYARARQTQAMLFSEQLVDIADETSQDFGDDGRFNREHVQRSTLRVDTRKWIMARILPKVFGDRLDVSGNISLGSDEGGGSEPRQRLSGAALLLEAAKGGSG